MIPMRPIRAFLMGVVILLWISGGSFCEVSAAETVPRFSSLQKGDRMKLVLESSGCFHGFSFEFIFSRSNQLSVAVTKLVPDWSLELKKVVTNRVQEGTLILSQSDEMNLDNLLTMLRQAEPCFSTTKELITASQTRQERIVATETFTNSACLDLDFGVAALPSEPSRYVLRDHRRTNLAAINLPTRSQNTNRPPEPFRLETLVYRLPKYR